MTTDAVECLDGLEAACANIVSAAELLIVAKHGESQSIEQSTITYLANQLILDQAEVVKGSQAVVDYVWHHTLMHHLPMPAELMSEQSAKTTFEDIGKRLGKLRIAANLLELAIHYPEGAIPSATVAYLVNRIDSHVSSGEVWLAEAISRTFGDHEPG